MEDVGILKRVHMVGIGGIGMSALAQLYLSRGIAVSGSDREASPVTDMIARKGIAVVIGHDGCSIPANTSCLVYSDAVPQDNPERERARQMCMRELSYFEALGEASRDMRTIAIAGTHGKTTTTAMLAHILHTAGKKPMAIVGSIVQDWGSNFMQGDSEMLVIEACEYRDHILKLSPEILVITNIELDHTDYFPTLEALQRTFRTAAEKVPAHGIIVTNPHDANVAPILSAVKARIIDYTQEEVPELSLIGEFNRANARAAKAAAEAAFPDITDAVIDDALVGFRGSWRRFEYKGETPAGATVYDDYAHHPTAVRATIEAARQKFPDQRIVVAFHPHLHSRTERFLQEFADALDTADRAIVAPIYEARTEAAHAVSHHTLARAGKRIEAMDSFDEIRDTLLSEPEGTLIITMGAGDIYKVAEQIVVE